MSPRVVGAAAAVILGGTLLALSLRGTPASAVEIHVYKDASCACCTKWIDHLRAAGFQVVSEDVPDLRSVKRQAGVPDDLASCHTALVGDYVIEGHVPADAILEFLKQGPAVAGLAVPGMPVGSPGMEGANPVAYDILAFDESGNRGVYARRAP